MARRARQMLRDSLTAFVRADGALGREVCRADDEVDAMHNSVFRILVTHMMEDARTITPSLELLLVSRNLERVADLATNIGEDAVFLAEGKQIKHHAEDRRPAGCRGAASNANGVLRMASRGLAPDALRTSKDGELASCDTLRDTLYHESLWLEVAGTRYNYRASLTTLLPKRSDICPTVIVARRCT